jgi:hypothetical protein
MKGCIAFLVAVAVVFLVPGGVSAVPIIIVDNPSFEGDMLSDGIWISDVAGEWTVNSNAGAWNPQNAILPADTYFDSLDMPD